jgi:RimJ/RimL family protein N-acetyltransferase
MQLLDPKNINFVQMTHDDISLVLKWLDKDFVKEWYHEPEEQTYEEAYKMYEDTVEGKDMTTPFIILYADQKIGYIQVGKVSDFREYDGLLDDLSEETCAIDLFIGEENFIHKGLGSHIIQKFLNEIAFDLTKTSLALIGPEPKNKSAIKAYKKTGFKYFKTIHLDNEPEPEFIMTLKKV